MFIPDEIFSANNGANLYLDHNGFDEHQWTFMGHQLAVRVFANDATQAFIDVFIDNHEGDDDDGYFFELTREERDRACVLALTGEIASAEMVLMINELVAAIDKPEADSLKQKAIRVVPIVDANVVHQAEADFFVRHPGTDALIEDWMKNVNALVYGTEKPKNMVF